MFQKSADGCQILEENLKDVKDLPTGDFLTDGIHFISKRRNEILISKLDCQTEVKISMESNIFDLTMKDQNVLILQDFQFSLLNLTTQEIHLKGHSSIRMVSTCSNPHVVSILDVENTIHLYTWTGKIKIVLISNLNLLPRSDQPQPTLLLAYQLPESAHPHLLLHQSLHMSQ